MKIGTKKRGGTKRVKKQKEWQPFTNELIKVKVNNMATQKIMREEDLDDESIDLDQVREQMEDLLMDNE